MARTTRSTRRTRRTYIYRQTKIEFQVIKRYRTKKVQALEKAQNGVLELPAPSNALDGEVVEKIGDLDLQSCKRSVGEGRSDCAVVGRAVHS